MACNKAGIGYRTVTYSYYDTYVLSNTKNIIETVTKIIINKSTYSPTIIPKTKYEKSIVFNNYTTKIKLYYDKKENKWKIPYLKLQYLLKYNIYFYF